MIICQMPRLSSPPANFLVGQKWQSILLTPTKRAVRTICVMSRKWSASWLSISRSREDDHAADARRKVLDKKRPPPLPPPQDHRPSLSPPASSPLFPLPPIPPITLYPLLSPYPTLSSMCSCGGSSGLLLYIIYIYILVLYSCLYYYISILVLYSNLYYTV